MFKIPNQLSPRCFAVGDTVDFNLTFHSALSGSAAQVGTFIAYLSCLRSNKPTLIYVFYGIELTIKYIFISYTGERHNIARRRPKAAGEKHLLMATHVT
jgi:hypothetical protein